MCSRDGAAAAQLAHAEGGVPAADEEARRIEVHRKQVVTHPCPFFNADSEIGDNFYG